MPTEPRKLIKLIDGLTASMRSWTILYAETYGHATKVQDSLLSTKDSLERFVRRMSAESKEALADCHGVKAIVDDQIRDARNASQEAQKSSKASSQLDTETRDFLNKWQRALERARAELAAARDALRIAENNLEHAEWELREAEKTRDAAERSYNYCINTRVTDSKGNSVAPNCSFERSALDDASRKVSECLYEVERCRNEVNNARNRVRLAEAEESRCEAGVNAANGFVQRAKTASEDCAALRQKTRDAEVVAREAQTFSQKARKEAEQAKSSAQTATSASKRVKELEEEAAAKVKLLRTAKLEQDAISTKSIQSLQSAVSELMVFDQPGDVK